MREIGERPETETEKERARREHDVAWICARRRARETESREAKRKGDRGN